MRFCFAGELLQLPALVYSVAARHQGRFNPFSPVSFKWVEIKPANTFQNQLKALTYMVLGLPGIFHECGIFFGADCDRGCRAVKLKK
jgi:hypothetical protein